jgi:hypothetical protein
MEHTAPKGVARTADHENLTVPPAPAPAAKAPPPKEVGGPKGKEPTRYGDWEVKGRCVDF